MGTSYAHVPDCPRRAGGVLSHGRRAAALVVGAMVSLISKHRPSPAEHALAALQTIMRDAEQNRELLLAYVLGGHQQFVNTLSRELRGLPIDGRMIDLVWQWLWVRKGEHPTQEYEALCEARYQRHLQELAIQKTTDRLYGQARRREVN